MWGFVAICEGIIGRLAFNAFFPWQAARPMLTARLTPAPGQTMQGAANVRAGVAQG